MAKGDIVLIIFPFTDMTGSKLRPALILAENALDITVCFITSQIGRKDDLDIFLTPTPENGLRKHSLCRTSKIATIDKTLVKGLLGKFSDYEINELNNNLKILLKLK